jgi:hypothetical protein
MKKSLEDLCFLAIAGAGLLCLIALLVAVLQVPTAGVVNSSSAPTTGSVAVNFVENHHNAVIASGIFLLVLVPLGAKFLPRLRRRRRLARTEVDATGIRMSPYSVPNDSIFKDSSDSILKPEYRSAYGKAREVSSSSLVGSRKAS